MTCAVPAAFLLIAKPGSYKLFWTLFGTSNQLLAGLSLLGITVWLRREGKRSFYTFLPMCFVLGITFWALSAQLHPLLDASADTLARVNAVVALVLLLLAVGLVIQGARVLLQTLGAGGVGSSGTAVRR